MRNNIILRLAIYYLAWLLALGVLFAAFPGVLYEWGRERAHLNDRSFFGISAEVSREPIPEFPGSWDAVPEKTIERLNEGTVGTTIALALALAFGMTLPLVWVYRCTHSGKKYQQSFVHSLVLLPIGIALVVFLVKGSLALAFCLAGIVAAVRYRASISQPLDAVYVLVAMGIGLASATQLIQAAFIGSTGFVVLALVVSKSNFGAQPAVLSGWRIAPRETQEPVNHRAAASEEP